MSYSLIVKVIFIFFGLDNWTKIFVASGLSFINSGIWFERFVAMTVFVILALTDKLDGWIARSFDMVTEWGTFLDPVVDKFLVISTLIALCFINWWLIIPTIIISTREIYVAIKLNYFRILGYKVVTIYSGKVKMVVQCISISIFFLPLSGLWLLVSWVPMLLSLYLTISSGMDYIKAFSSAKKICSEIGG
jgi:CDP-diacylglycerol--glycerol-3-phosphate 3-phosphatidyltransferase